MAVEKALDQGLEEPLNYLGRKSIRVATMCSGTESPLLALDLISQGEFFFFGFWFGFSPFSCLEIQGIGEGEGE